MAEFLWLKFGEQAPICQQTDKSGRLHIPTIAASFLSDPQSIRLNSIGFNWERDSTSPAYGYTDNNILEQIQDTGRSKEKPIVVDGTPSAGDGQLTPALLHSSLFNVLNTSLQHELHLCHQLQQCFSSSAAPLHETPVNFSA